MKFRNNWRFVHSAILTNFTQFSASEGQSFFYFFFNDILEIAHCQNTLVMIARYFLYEVIFSYLHPVLLKNKRLKATKGRISEKFSCRGVWTHKKGVWTHSSCTSNLVVSLVFLIFFLYKKYFLFTKILFYHRFSQYLQLSQTNLCNY